MGPETCLGSGWATGRQGRAAVATEAVLTSPSPPGDSARFPGRGDTQPCGAVTAWPQVDGAPGPGRGEGPGYAASLLKRSSQPADAAGLVVGSHVLLVPARLFWDLAWCWRGAGGGVRTHRSSPTPSPGRVSVSPLQSSLGLWAGGVRAHKGPPRAQGTARRGDSPSQKGPVCLPQGSGSPGSPRPECCAASETLTLHPWEVLLGPGQGMPEVSAE